MPIHSQHTPLYFFRTLRIPVLLLILAVVIGIAGFMLMEGYTLNEAFYMTIITLSTVGFQEVHPLSDGGRIFAALLIIGNIGIFAYSLSAITRFVVEGKFISYLQRRKMGKKVSQMKNHVIICGFGRYGQEISLQFQKHRIPFVIVEIDPENLEEVKQAGEATYIEGDASNDEILLEAGIEKARVLITTLPEVAENVYVILTARQLNPSLRIISRAFDSRSEHKLLRAGANHVITPEQIGGFYMASLVTKPDAVEFFTILTEGADRGISFEEVVFNDIPEAYQNKSIKELNIRKLTGANIVGLKTPGGDYIVNPSPNTKLEIGIGIIVLGTHSQVEQFKSLMSTFNPLAQET